MSVGYLYVFFGKCLFRYSSQFLISCLFVSVLSCTELASYQIYDVLSFPPIQEVVFLFCYWIICVVQRLFSLIEFSLFVFIFVAFAFAIRTKKSLPRIMSRSLSPLLSSRYFMVSGLVFKSLIYFELAFAYSIR